MGRPSDLEIQARLRADVASGWRLFIDEHTPNLLRAIEHSGVRDHDDIMELYVLTCEHLAADGCARLRRHDPAKGALTSWLATVVRRVLVDWVRSVRGRKRLFGSIRELSATDQAVFEQYYWRRQGVASIAEAVTESGRPIGLAATFAALGRIEQALTQRQRAELLAMAVRVVDPVALVDEQGELQVDVPAEQPDPVAAIHAGRQADALSRALAQVPAEDRLIVTMRFIDGLTLTEIQRALHIKQLPQSRLTAILEQLRAILDHGEGLTP